MDIPGDLTSPWSGGQDLARLTGPGDPLQYLQHDRAWSTGLAGVQKFV